MPPPPLLVPLAVGGDGDDVFLQDLLFLLLIGQVCFRVKFIECLPLHHHHHLSPLYKPSVLLAKLPQSLNKRFGKILVTTLCSSSNQNFQGSATSVSKSSIIGDFLDYLNESWTQFHATAEARRQLIAAGFQLLNENDEWDLKPGGRYFFTRNMSCLVAFAVGEKFKVGHGFHVIAAHTDSPCLKLKPKSASTKSGYLMVNVETYGAGLWHTWFDRDLSVAGRVILGSIET